MSVMHRRRLALLLKPPLEEVVGISLETSPHELGSPPPAGL